MQVFGRNDGANILLDSRDVLIGDFKPRAAGRLHVDDKLSGIRAREEGGSEQREEAEAEQKCPSDSDHCRHGPQQAFAHRDVVVHQGFVVAAVEPAHKYLERVAALVMAGLVMDVANEARAKERNHGHCHGIGGEQRKHDGERHGREQKPADSVEKDDREKDDGGGECCGQDGEGHFAPAFFRGLLGRLAHLKMAEDVFKHHDRVVDQAREGQRQASQHHGVDGCAHCVQDDESRQRGEWNGQHDGNRCAHAAEEDEDHDRGEKHADSALAAQVGDGRLDEDGLVEDDRGHQRLGNVEEMFEVLADSVDHGDGVAAAALLENGEIDGMLAVDANDVGLNRGVIFGIADVGDQKLPVADGF